MKSILLRTRNILVRPRDEWQVIKQEKATYGNLLRGYAAVLAAVPPVAAIAERFIFNRGLVSNAVHSPFGYVIASNVVWYLVIIINLIITGAVITAISDREGTGWLGVRGLKLAIYSFTPLFLVSSLIMVPSLSWFIYGAILYSVYLLWLGISSLFEVGQQRAAWYTAASFVVSGLILGTLNLFEYMLESFIAGKVFFKG
jgi:hypothetical protein